MTLPNNTKSQPLTEPPSDDNYATQFVNATTGIPLNNTEKSITIPNDNVSKSLHPACNSVFFTRQLLPGYPKTHLPTQHPFTNCTVYFQMRIDKIVGLEDDMLFVRSVKEWRKDGKRRESATTHTEDIMVDSDELHARPHIEHYRIAKMPPKNTNDHQLAIDSSIVDKVLSDQISSINRSRNTNIRTEEIYMSDINEGEKMVITTQWTEGDIHTMAERLKDGTQNIPVLEYLLTKMQVGEKLRILCSSNYFTGFEEKYNLVEREAHIDAKKLLQQQEVLQYERENPESHDGIDNIMVLDKGDVLHYIPQTKQMGTNQQAPMPIAIPKYLVIEIETNIFELPEKDRIEEARKYKELGNDAFKENLFDSALDHYFKGQRTVQEAKFFEDENLRESACTLLGEIILNICAILLKRNNASSVLRYTDEIMKLYPKDENVYIMVKALFRRAQARSILEEYDAALEDCEHALRLQPSNSALITLRKQLRAKRNSQRSKEKSLYSAFFKKSTDLQDNEQYIAENLMKSLQSQMATNTRHLPLNVIFNISEFLGCDIHDFALVCKDFYHVSCELEDRWKLICLRYKFYNASRDPDVYKWKNHCIAVFSRVRAVFQLPHNLRHASFPELAEIYRGSAEFFVDVCRRVTAFLDPNRIYNTEDAMIYAALKELHKYWSLETIYDIFGVQVEFGKPNTNEGTVELLKNNIEEYYRESAPEDREIAKYMFEHSKTIHTVDEAFEMMMESQWGLHGTIPTLMRCGFTYYNIQPKNLKMGFYCSDGLLALILEEQGFLREESIRKWMR